MILATPVIGEEADPLSGLADMEMVTMDTAVQAREQINSMMERFVMQSVNDKDYCHVIINTIVCCKGHAMNRQTLYMYNRVFYKVYFLNSNAPTSVAIIGASCSELHATAPAPLLTQTAPRPFEERGLLGQTPPSTDSRLPVSH